MDDKKVEKSCELIADEELKKVTGGVRALSRAAPEDPEKNDDTIVNRLLNPQVFGQSPK